MSSLESIRSGGIIFGGIDLEILTGWSSVCTSADQGQPLDKFEARSGGKVHYPAGKLIRRLTFMKLLVFAIF